MPIILVGNKLDARDNLSSVIAKQLAARGEHPISYEEGITMAKQINACKYLENSALTQQGLKYILHIEVAVHLYRGIFDAAIRCVIYGPEIPQPSFSFFSFLFSKSSQKQITIAKSSKKQEPLLWTCISNYKANAR